MLVVRHLDRFTIIVGAHRYYTDRLLELHGKSVEQEISSVELGAVALLSGGTAAGGGR